MSTDKFASFGSFPRGCHGSLPPTDIPAGYYHRGVNVTVRGGQVRTRPRFAPVANLAGIGAFRGAFVYSLDDADRLVYGRGDRVRVLNLSTLEDVEVATLASGTSRFHFVQVDRFCIVQDGISRPAFLDASSLLRYAAEYSPSPPGGNEVYTGTIMAYGHGRLFLVPRFLHTLDGIPDETKTGRPYWVAGSIIKPEDPEAALRFGEAQYLSGGIAAALPFESGFIQGLEFFQNAASGTGIGPLLVFGRKGVSAVSVNVPRDAWMGADFSQVLFLGPGTVSPYSIVAVNNDLLFRSLDGIRSVRLTGQSSASNSAAPLAVVPLSYEVAHRLSLDAPEDLPAVTSTFADNRFLMTLGAGRGLVSMDTAPSSALGQATPPAFEDLWTGYNFLQVVAARVSGLQPEPAAVVGDEASGYQLVHLSEQALVDGAGARPTCRLYFPATAGSGAQTIFELVKFLSLHVTFRGVRGPLTARIYFRADDYPRWCRGSEFSFTPVDDAAYSFPRITFGPLDPDAGTAAGFGLPFGIGRTIQVCLEWEGVASVAGAVVQLSRAAIDPSMFQTCEDSRPICEELPSSGLVTLEESDYEYEVQLP